MTFAPDDLAPVRDALPAGPVTFIHANAMGTLLAQTNDRLEQLLAERCELEESRAVAPSPLAALRRIFKPEAPAFHYMRERWLCARPAITPTP